MYIRAINKAGIIDYINIFLSINDGKMFIFMFKTTQEHLWGVYRLYLGIFGIFEFFDPLEGYF